jgi:hypothetical protein
MGPPSARLEQVVNHREAATRVAAVDEESVADAADVKLRWGVLVAHSTRARRSAFRGGDRFNV